MKDSENAMETLNMWEMFLLLIPILFICSLHQTLTISESLKSLLILNFYRAKYSTGLFHT